MEALKSHAFTCATIHHFDCLDISKQMLFRCTLRQPRIDTRHFGSRFILQSVRKRAFSPTFRHEEQSIRSSRTTEHSSKEQHGKQEQAIRGSVRPFTILLLCIPLGYGANWAFKNQNAAGHVSPDGFLKYMLAGKETVSSTCSIFSLIPSFANAAVNTTAPELERSITSVQFKQPQLQIARSYTLLPHVEGQDDDELRFLIKKEQKGEVSGYLHRLPLDAEVEVRGVSREYQVPYGVEKVIFLAGGTGIAPALQVANVLKRDDAEMHILWANRKREDCVGGVSDTSSDSCGAGSWSISRLWSKPPGADKMRPSPNYAIQKHPVVRDLEDAKVSRSASNSKLRVDYFIDEENGFIQPRRVSNLLQEASQGKNLLIVSGPDGFINYWAGPKQWFNGREIQGPIAGILGGMDTTGWEIVKL